MSMVIVDPQTRQPLGPIAGEVVRPQSVARHWVMERDETGRVVRMRWHERPASADEVRGIYKEETNG